MNANHHAAASLGASALLAAIPLVLLNFWYVPSWFAVFALGKNFNMYAVLVLGFSLLMAFHGAVFGYKNAFIRVLEPTDARRIIVRAAVLFTLVTVVLGMLYGALTRAYPMVPLVGALLILPGLFHALHKAVNGWFSWYWGVGPRGGTEE